MHSSRISAANQSMPANPGVISWRHSDIPGLVAALGATAGSYPHDWDERDYRLMIEITFREGAPPQVRQIMQPF